ncbi:MAG: hypothetical protein ACYTHN_17990 [Planctomycetota bacterium]|jgi:hypothetical protein
MKKKSRIRNPFGIKQPLAFLLILLAMAVPNVRGQNGNPAEKDLKAALKIVKEGIGALSLSEKDIRPRHDYIPADPYRLALVDDYLFKPLTVGVDAHKRFTPWLREKETLADSIVRACKTIGIFEKNGSKKPKIRKKKLSAAIEGLYKTFAGSGGGEKADKAALKEDVGKIPAPLHAFLAEWVQVVEMAAKAREGAFKKLTEDEWVLLRKFGSQFNTAMPRPMQMQYLRNYHARIDIEAICRASLSVADLCERLPEVNRELGTPADRPQFHVVFTTPAGRVEFGGWGRNIYKNDALLIVDFGGNDTYKNSAGGTLYTPKKISVCIDLAGNDTYETTVGLAHGSGMYGIGVLVDCEGNDLYASKNVSQGAGHVGVGILWDWSGDDRYKANSVSQGAGFQGVGLLRDDAGADTYEVGSSGQGYGNLGGFGILQDRGGDDQYTAGGVIPDKGRDASHFLSMAQGYGQGNRAGQLAHCASGGIGLLADWTGRDRYEADVFGQGCSYWYALGVLLDGAGDDEYKVHNYGQGAGIHMSVGVMMDFEGKDTYEGGAHALGHSLDRSVGFFADFDGDDTYQSIVPSDSQGAAVKPYAVAFFLDARGNDTYKDGQPGYVRVPGKDSEGMWPKAFFLDLGGKDAYAPSSGEAGNNKSWVTNKYGWGTDR